MSDGSADRAFNPDLFRMGTAPGPHCLLKLLRNKFKPTESSGAAQENDASVSAQTQDDVDAI